jgi:putative oxidoreductase
MQVLFVVGRVIFALYFIFAGAQRLLNVAGTAAIIANNLVIPPALLGTAGSIENAAGMSIPQLLAILSGAIELTAGILFSFNIGTRAMAALLILFPAVSIIWIHDFWTMSGDARANNVMQAMQDASLIGALMVFIAMGSSQPGNRHIREKL